MHQDPQSPLPIVPARTEHVHAFVSYLVQHVAESGRDSQPHFAVSTSIVPEEVERTALERWTKPLSEPRWGRAWLLWTSPPGITLDPIKRQLPPPRVVGHIELRGGRVPSELHRATLAIGVTRLLVGQRHGQRLAEVAIAWARDEAKLSYIDLGVFTKNERAKRLYSKLGFVEQGFRIDAFRIGGDIVDEIQMTLTLLTAPSPNHSRG